MAGPERATAVRRGARPLAPALVVAVAVAVALVAPACDTSSPGNRGGRSSGGSSSAVGDMSDTSYFGQRGKVVRPDARGSDVELADFAGSFLWVEYAAPWCGPCVPQAAAVRQVEKRYAGEVVFLTVVTSGPGGYGDPATVATAAAWARRVGHDPSRVLAADLTAMTIPRHLLFSPEGHVLLDRTGGLSAAELSAALDERMAGYRAWSDGGTRAPWMKTPG